VTAPEIRRVPAAATRPLRHRVLRPHQRIDEVAMAGDDDPEAGHFAAFAEDGAVVGVTSVMPEAPPWDRPASRGASPRWWRLRGMATAPEVRGQGVGAALFARAVGHAQGGGATALWCNARVGAVGFYRRLGMVTVGEPWDEPAIGPHIAMSMVLERTEPDR
jgi:GNAT superfamily N-acetyltransferase